MENQTSMEEMHFWSIRKSSGTPFSSSTLGSVKLLWLNWNWRAFLLQKTYVPSCTPMSHLCLGVTRKQSGRRKAGRLVLYWQVSCCMLPCGGGREPPMQMQQNPWSFSGDSDRKPWFPRFLWTEFHTLSWEGWADFTSRERTTKREGTHVIHLVIQPKSDQVNQYMKQCQILWKKMQQGKSIGRRLFQVG